ncbi:GGDEF-domain containing protein [Hahella sp. CCB-MM4]|uniref:EAL domain-containing protein n=1 Tax=Hahella sp. (strain CCB-MM4) TaxID=1926491 RepID=UPI000B9C636C|nr:EAL domain-containing protein [Hahella sp. CCB-MM4]OZG73872.1 GGDEF-domain containing protein [Hahella sp. CCB-MM4]
MHKLLKKQIKELLPDGADLESLTPFIEAVEKTYLSSESELQDLRYKLQDTSSLLNKRFQQLTYHLKQTENTKLELEHSLSLLNATLNATYDGIVVIDENNNPVTWNDMFLSMFSLDDSQSTIVISNKAIKDKLMLLVRNPEEFEQSWTFNQTYPDQPSYCVLSMNDGRFIECNTNPRYHQGRNVGRVWSFSDITEIRIREQQAIHKNYHDDLTRLPNRALIYDRINHAIQGGGAQKEEHAILFIGLDGFKYINEALGLEVGDELLVAVAKRLHEDIPPKSTLARYGGDEFILFLENIRSSFEASLAAEKLRLIIEKPFEVKDQTLHLTTSTGIALYPTDGADAETLIRKADMAMYHAKNKGRNNVQFFARELELLTSHRMNIRNSLKRAIDNQEFHLLYQPKVDLKTRSIIGVEALIRWKKPSGQVISPMDFIPAAEEHGFIVDIGNWVLEEACRQMTQWRQLYHTPFDIAVNISGQHFQKERILHTVDHLFSRYHLPPDSLEIEITESVIMNDMDEAIMTLQQLKKMGVNASIDDFGTGYSSLNYLKRLPVNTLKIDKIFVDDITKSRRDMALVDTMISLAHHLNMKTVAEGVETRETLELLTQLGCDIGQGYYFSHPVSADEITHLLQQDSSLETVKS